MHLPDMDHKEGIISLWLWKHLDPDLLPESKKQTLIKHASNVPSDMTDSAFDTSV